ncbi:hypothetical protein THAOC_24872 [Thalassiosira oceanica]|uniref:Uncharacterized protein n=1 Tax=Thalassiosira oceanica TaxID=159749 RepID=K0S9G8_THAOC|nr:hypothetical protein THAOC_24872 [Thalassiosira oceanica]|eukprot:EJK55402.1 hypothetical protein THAOC_24872 [Thalassiosira oceanica]
MKHDDDEGERERSERNRRNSGRTNLSFVFSGSARSPSCAAEKGQGRYSRAVLKFVSSDRRTAAALLPARLAAVLLAGSRRGRRSDCSRFHCWFRLSCSFDFRWSQARSCRASKRPFSEVAAFFFWRAEVGRKNHAPVILNSRVPRGGREGGRKRKGKRERE